MKSTNTRDRKRSKSPVRSSHTPMSKHLLNSLTKGTTKLNHCYFQISKNLQKVVDQISAPPFYAGTRILCEGKRVHLGPVSLQQLEATLPSLTVTRKAEWLFVCGRDILKKGIFEISEPLGPGDEVIVKDKAGNLLGVGVVEEISNDDITLVRSTYDIGDYLRRE